jgi:hypothetical protein
MTGSVLRLAVLAGSLAVTSAHAGVPSLAECVEGSDFVANAAHARDNGITREDFLGRMRGDFEVIRSFPVSMRWFVKDRDDEHFLIDVTTRVFETPQLPDRHRSDFLDLCLQRALA